MTTAQAPSRLSHASRAAAFLPLLLAALPAAAQPSACTTAWTTFNPTVGPSGPVGGAICFHDGRLIMRGAILSAGGVPISNRVALWDGLAWTDASQGFTLDPLVNNSGANQMVSAFGNVYAVGELVVNNPPDIPRRHPGLYWNGQVWQRTPRTGMSNARSFFFFPTGGKLYSSGAFSVPDAQGFTLYTRTLGVMDAAGVWRIVGPGNYDVSGVSSIVEFGGEVFIAGGMTRMDHMQLNPQHIPVRYAARLIGNDWFEAGTGFNAPANIIEFNGVMYAYGNFTASGDGVDPLPRFARWNSPGWLPVGVNGAGEPGAGFSSPPFGAFVGDDSRGPALFFRLDGNALNVAPGYPPSVFAAQLVRFDGVGFTAVPNSGLSGINGFTSGELRNSGPAVYAAMNNRNLGTGGPGHLARLGRAQEADADGDGLPDQWETQGQGLDVNCDGTIDLDLWALGASPQHKDLFIEIDAMFDQAPDLNTLTLVQDAFNNAPVSNPDGFNGIRVHMYVDEGNLPIQHLPDGLAGLRRIKRDHFGTYDDRFDDPNGAAILEAKRRVYRYCLFASRHGSGSSCGLAESPGNDFMVSLGHIDWANVLAVGGYEKRAATFMHMLGHTMGLTHGGHQHDVAAPHRYNFKPNYHSVMNFSWQLSTGRAGWRMDYSRQALPVLDELFLGEFQGIGGNPDALAIIGPPPCRNVPEAGQIDYDRDGVFDLPFVMADVNHVCACLPSSSGDRLEGFLDWTALRMNFRDTAGYLDGGGTVTTAGDEMTFEIYQALQQCTTPMCLADFDDGTGSGTPDGGVTIDDLLYFLNHFDSGDIRCDVDDGSGTGTRDGGVTIDDLLYYLVRFDSGC